MKTLLMHIPRDTHAKLKAMASDKGTSMTQLIVKMINETGHDDDFINIPPGLEPINTSATYTTYEKEIAGGLLQQLSRARIMTLAELTRALKPQPQSVLIRMLQVCIHDKYIKYEDGQFIFITFPK